jgi:uncharacterized membrane protein (DUF4010 family)
MFARVLIEVAVVHPPLLARVTAPMLAMLGVAVLAAGVFYRRGRAAPAGSSDVALKNPFSLTSAIKFAALFSLVLLAVVLVQTYAPGKGELLVAAIAGLTDVDAITLSMATFARDGGSADTAAQAITVAAFSNTLVKCGLVVGLADPAFRGRIIAVTAALVVAGTLALLVA